MTCDKDSTANMAPLFPIITLRYCLEVPSELHHNKLNLDHTTDPLI